VIRTRHERLDLESNARRKLARIDKTKAEIVGSHRLGPNVNPGLPLRCVDSLTDDNEGKDCANDARKQGSTHGQNSESKEIELTAKGRKTLRPTE
jgi:hypothetical protein